jgi:hypothetical protein
MITVYYTDQYKTNICFNWISLWESLKICKYILDTSK